MKVLFALFAVVALATANMQVQLFTDGNCMQVKRRRKKEKKTE